MKRIILLLIFLMTSISGHLNAFLVSTAWADTVCDFDYDNDVDGKDLAAFAVSVFSASDLEAFAGKFGKILYAGSGWRVLPIRSQEEFSQGKTGGEAEQHPHSIARSLSNPDIIYLSHDICGAWRSENSGDSWIKAMDRGLSVNQGQSIEVDPYNPNIVFLIADNSWDYFADDDEGLFRSVNSGDTWTRVLQTDTNYDSGIHRIYRHNIAYDLSSVTSSGAMRWYVAFPDNGLFRSENNGITWTEDPVSSLAGHTTMYAVKTHPIDGQTVYIASSQGLFVSRFLGADLEPLGNLPGGAVSSIEINPQNPSMIYATVRGDGLYRSLDGGATFSELRDFDASRVFMNPGHPHVLYLVGLNSNTIISNDAGGTWITDMETHPAPGLGRDGSWKGRIAGGCSGIVPNPDDPNEAVAFSRATLWKTIDGGHNFMDSSTLFTGFAWSWFGHGAAFDRFNPDRFAFFNCDVGMTITDTGGDYFDQRNSEAWGWYSSGLISWIGTYSGDFRPIADSQEMVASVGGYFHTQLMHTDDEGGQWEILTDSGHASENDSMNLFISFHPNDDTFVYAGNKISEDGGQTFSHIDFGAFDNLDPYIIGMCPAHPDTVYAFDYNGYYILRSDNRGATWQEYAHPGWRMRPFDPLPTFAVDPANSDKIYTVYNDGDLAIFDGTTWTKTNVLSLAGGSDVGNYVRCVAIDPVYPQIIYAGMFSSGIHCVFRSTDGGVSWTDISENLPMEGAGAIKVNPHTGELFKGSGFGTWIYPPPSGFIYNSN